MRRAVTITGTRSVPAAAGDRLDELFRDYLLPFASADLMFYVGGAVGIDSLTLTWLARNTNAALTVVTPCSLKDQPEAAQEAVEACRRAGRLAELVELGGERLGTATYHARNRWMVDRSGFVVGFPVGEDDGSGTWYTLNYSAEQGKPRLIVPLWTVAVVE
jgi:hypothetical protein